MEQDGLFNSINQSGQSLEYLEGLSLEELKKSIQSIQYDCRIVAIYPFGQRHVAWILTSAKIKKVKKEK